MSAHPRARALELVLLLLATATVGWVVVTGIVQGVSLSPWWLLAVLLIVPISASPLYLNRYDTWLVIGLESVVLVFAALQLPTHLALLVWCAGVLASQVLPWRARYKLFNASVTIVSGAVAVLLVDALRSPGNVDMVQDVIAVLVGFAAYYTIDVSASVLDIAYTSGGPRERHRPGRVVECLVLFGVFMGVNAGGILADVVERAVGSWGLVLCVAPLVIVVLAVRALTRERETARRLTVLFELARSVHSAQSETQVVEEVERGVRIFGKDGTAGVRTDPPARGESGRPLICEGQVRWLVLEEGRGPRGSSLTNAEALSNIVQQAEEGLSRIRMTRELTYNAQHDALTTLTNRAVFTREVEQTLIRLRGGGSRCAVLFCDLDGFKKINDQFGHEAGDAVLQEIAHRLRVTVPVEHVVARLGGDEFAVLVDGDGPEAEEVAAALLEVVVRPIDFAGGTVVISVSIGIAYSGGTHTADQLVRNADIAMYDAKRSGRDRVVEYHPLMGTARVRTLEMVDQLRRAVQSGDLGVVYQPVTSARDGSLVGMEALVRWTLEGETIPPDVFIPLAEEANLIQPLGELVLDVVSADLPVITAAVPPTVSIAVNISALQIVSGPFVDAALAMMDRLGDHPLVMEITETEAMSDELIASTVMEEMIEHGVRFHVDDFGVGFSSLGYLMKLPVQGFKLDRLFSGSIDRDQRNAELLGSVVAMGEALGLDIVVEGIERQSQIEVIRSLVDPDAFERLSWQGYLLGKPMPPLDLASWVAARGDQHVERPAAGAGGRTASR